MRMKGHAPRRHGQSLATAARTVIQHPHPRAQVQDIHNGLRRRILQLDQALGIGWRHLNFSFATRDLQGRARKRMGHRRNPFACQTQHGVVAADPRQIDPQKDRSTTAHCRHCRLVLRPKRGLQSRLQPVRHIQRFGAVRSATALLRPHERRRMANPGEKLRRIAPVGPHPAQHQPAPGQPATKGGVGPAVAQAVEHQIADRVPVARSGIAVGAPPVYKGLLDRGTGQYPVQHLDCGSQAGGWGHEDRIAVCMRLPTPPAQDAQSVLEIDRPAHHVDPIDRRRC